VPFTRINEYKHLTGQVAPSTSITYEYPAENGDPYYPIPRAENQALFKRYEALALEQGNVTSSAGSRPIVTTTWTRSSDRHSPCIDASSPG
jgi:UDP-galactopyranose mutase